MYQVGPFSIEPWPPLGMHVSVALIIMVLLTVLLISKLCDFKSSHLDTFISIVLYCLLFPFFLFITPIVIYHYNSNGLFQMASLYYFWILVATFYFLSFANWRKGLTTSSSDYILALYLSLSSAGALRIIIYITFELLKASISTEATFLFTAIYMTTVLIILFSTLKNLRHNIPVLYLTLSGTIGLLILFFARNYLVSFLNVA